MIEFTNFKLVPVKPERSQYEVLIWTFDFNTYINLDLEKINFDGDNSSPLPFPSGRHINRSELFLDLVNKELPPVLSNVINSGPAKDLAKGRWMWDTDTLLRKSRILSNLLKDMPGFEMGEHLDNQFIVGNVILNLADNPCCTKFHKIKPKFFEREVYYEGPKEKHKGIFFLNMPGTLHSVKNSSNYPRYVLNSYWMLNN